MILIKRFLATLLAISMIASVYMVPAFADDIAPYSSTMIETYQASLSISGSYLQVYMYAQAHNTMGTLGVSTFYVQKKSGSTWTTVYSGINGYYSYNTSSFVSNLSSCTYSSNSTYRVCANFYAKNGSRSESKYYISDSIQT